MSCLQWIRCILQHHRNFWYSPTSTLETEYQALELTISPNNTIMKLKYRDLYTWLFKSRDKLAQYFVSKESNKHHQTGPLVWKLITTNISCGVKQVICSTQNMIYTLSFKKLDISMNSLVNALKGHHKLLASCG